MECWLTLTRPVFDASISAASIVRQLPVFDASMEGFRIQDSVVGSLKKTRRQKPVVNSR
jgi:hypothetical protein